MRKFFTVLALAIVTIGLIIGGIICFVQYGNVTENIQSDLTIKTCGYILALGIAMFIGGIGSGVATIGNFFTARTRDK